LKPLTDINDPRLVKALAHPLRVRILSILETRNASPNELSKEIGAPLGTVSYHVRRLDELGLVKLVSTAPRRGAVEHYYKAEATPRVTDKAWSQAPEIVKQALVGASLGQLSEQVNDAAVEGGFSRDGAYLARMPVLIDQQGWDDLNALMGRVEEEVDQIAAASEKRLRKSDHEGELAATAVVMLFERALKPAAAGRAGRRSRARSAAVEA